MEQYWFSHFKVPMTPRRSSNHFETAIVRIKRADHALKQQQSVCRTTSAAITFQTRRSHCSHSIRWSFVEVSVQQSNIYLVFDKKGSATQSPTRSLFTSDIDPDHACRQLVATLKGIAASLIWCSIVHQQPELAAADIVWLHSSHALPAHLSKNLLCRVYITLWYHLYYPELSNSRSKRLHTHSLLATVVLCSYGHASSGVQFVAPVARVTIVDRITGTSFAYSTSCIFTPHTD